MVLRRDSKPQLAGDLVGLRGDFFFKPVEHRRLGIAQIQREKDLAGNDVGRAGLDLQDADGADRRWIAPRIRVDRFDHARGAEQRVVPARHRRGAGMAVLAGDGHFVPAHGLHAGDDADVFAFGFEVRALLDMHFEKRREFMIAAALRPAIADFIERIAEVFAAAVGARRRPVAFIDAGEHAGRDHRRGKARAFLVGPVHHFDRREGLVAGANKRAQRFQRGQHAKRAVEFAAGRLRVEMAAHGDRRHVVALAGTAREHRAHVVDGDRAAERLAPAP